MQHLIYHKQLCSSITYENIGLKDASMQFFIIATRGIVSFLELFSSEMLLTFLPELKLLKAKKH